MIAKHRRACSATSSETTPSGRIAAVALTNTWSSTRTARENPIHGSSGDPEATRCLTPSMLRASAANAGDRRVAPPPAGAEQQPAGRAAHADAQRDGGGHGDDGAVAGPRALAHGDHREVA